MIGQTLGPYRIEAELGRGVTVHIPRSCRTEKLLEFLRSRAAQ